MGTLKIKEKVLLSKIILVSIAESSSASGVEMADIVKFVTPTYKRSVHDDPAFRESILLRKGVEHLSLG